MPRPRRLSGWPMRLRPSRQRWPTPSASLITPACRTRRDAALTTHRRSRHRVTADRRRTPPTHRGRRVRCRGRRRSCRDTVIDHSRPVARMHPGTGGSTTRCRSRCLRRGFRTRDRVAQDDVVVRADLEWLAEFLNPQRNLGWLGWFDALEANDLSGMQRRLQRQRRLGAARPCHRRQPPGLLGRRVAWLGSETTAVPSWRHIRRCSRTRTAPNSASGFSRASPSARRTPRASAFRPSHSWSTCQLPAQGRRPGLLAAVDRRHRARRAPRPSPRVGRSTSCRPQPRVPQALALDAKTRLFYRALEVLRPVRSSLSLADIEGLRLVAEELATSLPDDFEVQASECRPGRALPTPRRRRRRPLLADGVCDYPRSPDPAPIDSRNRRSYDVRARRQPAVGRPERKRGCVRHGRGVGEACGDQLHQGPPRRPTHHPGQLARFVRHSSRTKRRMTLRNAFPLSGASPE